MARLKPVCPDCGGELEVSIGYTGCDWDCEHGEGSGFGWQLSLDCNRRDCMRVFPVGMLREFGHFARYVEGVS